MKKAIITYTPDETISRTVAPKPSKAEVIEALVELQLQKELAVHKEATEKHEEATAKSKELFRAYLKKNAKALMEKASISVSGRWGANVRVNFQSLDEFKSNEIGEEDWPLDANLIKILEDFESHPCPKWIDPDRRRKEIRKELTDKVSSRPGGRKARLETLLTSPESRAALETILSDLTGSTEAIESGVEITLEKVA